MDEPSSGLDYWGSDVPMAEEDPSGFFQELRGTSKAFIENLDSVVITQQYVDDANVICAVCLDDMNVGDLGKQLPCFHRYHGDCIVPWLVTHDTCPVCRYLLAPFEKTT